MINLELKNFCEDFKPVRKIMRSIGAEKIFVKKQEDSFFYLPFAKDKRTVKRLKLRNEDGKKTLILYERDAFSAQKHASSDFSVLPVTDDKLIGFLSDALGVKVVVRKTRELWRKDNAVFHLDKVRGVGDIFEIELKTDSKNMKLDEKKFDGYRAKLRPYLGKIIKGSNEDLVFAAERVNNQRIK